MKATTAIKLTRRKMDALFSDNVKSAEIVNLQYVTDKDPGITRIMSGDSFRYVTEKGPVKDPAALNRIKSLVLPPAWQEVWICTQDNGHLQATGYDALNRKQYKYHPLWNKVRNQTKFAHLHEFGKALPAIRQRLQKDLRLHGLPVEKVLATIVSLMECTCIRIGNSAYEKLYGSFGLTTLKDKHVGLEAGNIHFTFKGKKGVHHDINLKSKKLATIVKQCRDIPGQQLFQYYDKSGQRKSVDSGMVNDYIKKISGGNFTAKDFRTWAGTLHAIEAFKQLGYSDTEAGIKKNVIAALDMVAEQLGNTRTVCKKYYVHPMVIEQYTSRTMDKYGDIEATADCKTGSTLTPAEEVLMSMLEHRGVAVIAA